MIESINTDVVSNEIVPQESNNIITTYESAEDEPWATSIKNDIDLKHVQILLAILNSPLSGCFAEKAVMRDLIEQDLNNYYYKQTNPRKIKALKRKQIYYNNLIKTIDAKYLN